MSRTLREWQVRFYEQAKQRGLLDGLPSDRDGDDFRAFVKRKLGHVMEEVCEAFDDVRDERLEGYFRMDEHDEPAPHGLPDSLADMMATICIVAGVCGVDIDQACLEAYAYGQKRIAHQHGGKPRSCGS